MNAALRSLAALLGAWLAWLAAGWLAARIAPGGGTMLIEAGIFVLLLGGLARLIDQSHQAQETEPHA